MQKQKISIDDAGTLILYTAIIFGTFFRLMPAWRAGFPINDGGMFYSMILDLQANHYVLPLYTTYNNLNIPFVYPPLGFYIGAIISELFNFTSPLPLIQWLPGIFNALCIPAFYFLAKQILENKFQGALSTLVFALTPHMTAWFSMGGGLTRALGAFFMLLALTHIHRLLTKGSNKDFWGAIIFSSLAVLSHTEAPIYTATIAIYIWITKSRTSRGLLKSVLVVICVLALSAPWYGWVIFKHGFAPFISASQTGLHSTWSALRFLNIDIMTEERYLDLLGAIGIVGMAALVAKRNFFIPGMFLIIFFVHPRSAHTIGNIPLALAAGTFIGEFIVPALSKRQSGPEKQTATSSLDYALFLLVLIPFLLSNSIFFAFRLSEMHVTISERDSMQWAANNTPKDSTFLLITGEPNGFCDSTSEWFPALANRHSLATLQGNEWLKGADFRQHAVHIQNLQFCAKKGLDCILQEMDKFDSGFDYLYLSLDSPTSNCGLTDASDITRLLIPELENSPQFQAVFRSDDAMIFRKK